ncbi:response regulator [Planctomycetota bacterium]
MAESLKVMIVDDEEIVCRRLRSALEKSDYQCETFVDGKSALARLEEQAFDIVVTDVRLGQDNGIELFETVNERWPRAKVIIMTGYATMEVAREALLKGAFDFIAKPFKPNDLREAIARAAKELT